MKVYAQLVVTLLYLSSLAVMGAAMLGGLREADILFYKQDGTMMALNLTESEEPVPLPHSGDGTGIPLDPPPAKTTVPGYAAWEKVRGAGNVLLVNVHAAQVYDTATEAFYPAARSRDGRSVAFVTPNEANTLYVANVEVGTVTALVTLSRIMGWSPEFHWSPSGRWLVGRYGVGRGGAGADEPGSLYVINVDDGRVINIDDAHSPQWLPR